MTISLRIVVMLLAVMAAGSARGQDIVIEYQVRAPYTFVVGGRLTGLLGDRVMVALAAAGVPFKLAEVPPSRQLADLRDDVAPVCAIGWFKTPERERFARYSRPLYRDQAIAVLTRVTNSRVVAVDKIEPLLAARDLTLGVRANYSYGTFLDERIAAFKPVRHITEATTVQMILQLVGERFDYMFIGPEEASAAIAEAGVGAAQLVLHPLSDMPPGEQRYLLCSHKVGDELFSRINARL
jgi:uncharacterized protein (TIGR02285 family)